MIDILKRIFIGVAIGMSIFFIKSYCFALSYDFNTEDNFAFWNTNKYFAFTSTCYNQYGNGQSDFTFDNSYYNTQYDYIMFNYNLTTSFPITQNSTSAFYTSTSYVWLLFDNGATNCTYDSGMLLCPLLKNQTLQKIRFVYPCLQDSFTFEFMFTRYGTFLSSNSNTITSNSTDTLNETKKITDENDRSGNGDTYDNTGITSNNNKEDALTQDTESSINNFNIDLSSNANAFQYIFFLLDKFVKANSKIFGVVLSLLGFGFVRLVLGR